MVVNMFARNRPEASGTPQDSSVQTSSGRKRLGLRRRLRGERGGAMIELALTMPMLLAIVTAIYSFGVYFKTLMVLTDAVNVGTQQLSIYRSNTLDPCNLVYTAVTNAAPNLNSANMTFAFVLDGVNFPSSGSYTGGGTNVSCSSTSTSTGAAADLVSGTNITVTVTYPCNLEMFGRNLVPSCVMTAQLSEIEQ
jgi:Flp pilus assembly protein TadG